MHNDGAVPPTAILMEAIARHIAVTAIYNRQQVQLAPHIAYTRHGDLFIDGVVIERDGRPPRELKLGSFKFAGLSEIALTRRHFDPSPLFDPAAERYVGATLFVLAREPAPVG